MNKHTGRDGAWMRILTTTTSRRHRGQDLVELALILPVFALLTMGVVDLGRIFYTYEALANAAREGARYCALNVNLGGGTAGTLARVQGELNGTGITPTLVPGYDCSAAATPGSPVEIRVSAVFTPITTQIANLTGQSVTLTAAATMVVWQ
jgi:Flp pilus assembly protein TadG